MKNSDDLNKSISIFMVFNFSFLFGRQILRFTTIYTKFYKRVKGGQIRRLFLE